MTYAIEQIDDNDILYYRVHLTHVDNNKIPRPSAFFPIGNGMSTNWNKYVENVEKLLEGKDVNKIGVVKFDNVSKLRNIPSITVMHCPTRNQSHSIVDGTRDPEKEAEYKANPSRNMDGKRGEFSLTIRVALKQLSSWVIKPNGLR